MVVEALILETAFSYVMGKIADETIKKIQDESQGSYEDILRNYMEDATKQMCEHFGLNGAENAASKICYEPPATASKQDIRDSLSAALEGEDIQDSHAEYWQQKLFVAISKDANLYRYLEMYSAYHDTAEDTKDKVQEVIDQYAENFTKKLFLHTLSKNNVCLEQLYVAPLFSKKEDAEERDKTQIDKVIPLFLNSQEQEEIQVLMINGHAAVGKTSLVSWLCYHYKKDDAIKKNILGNHSLVCVRLRDLTLGEEKRNGADIVLSYLGIKDMDNFNQLYKNAVLVLDGADELCMLEQGKFSVEKFLKEICGKFQHNKIIVTSRPRFFDTGKLGYEKYHFDSVFLCHLNARQRGEWVAKYKSCGETLEQETEEYIINLDEKAARGIADTPLGLYLLSKSNIGKELVKNPWCLYHEIFRNAILETPYNKNFNAEKYPVAENPKAAKFIYSL